MAEFNRKTLPLGESYATGSLGRKSAKPIGVSLSGRLSVAERKLCPRTLENNELAFSYASKRELL
jgi:hypothetical protein